MGVVMTLLHLALTAASAGLGLTVTDRIVTWIERRKK